MSTNMTTNMSTWVKGFVTNTPLVCEYKDIPHKTVFNYGYDPFDYMTPMILVHLILIFFVTRVTFFVLRLFQQNMLIAQIIAGIIIGPSCLTHHRRTFDIMFPPRGHVLLKTLGYFGLMIHLFGLGVNSNTTMFKNVERRIVFIGLSSFLCSVGASLSTLFIFQKSSSMIFESYHALGLPIVLLLNSVSPFIVITSVLIDLKMINSELGNVASSVSVVTDFIGWVTAVLGGYLAKLVLNYNSKQASLATMCTLGYYLAIFFIFRPLVIYITKHTPEGRPMTETHFFTIITIVLGVALLGQILGQSSVFVSFLFGLVLPDGPPLGTILIEKFGVFSSSILLPVFCTVSGLRTNLNSLNIHSSPLIGSVLLMGYLGKFFGTLVSTSLLGHVSLNDALPLALILSCKGLVELAAYGTYKDSRIISEEVFTLAIISMLIMTGISLPLVKFLYDPSTKYTGYGGQSIIHLGYNGVMKILVCIFKEDNVPSIINLLQVAKVAKESPLRVFVLQLFELVGHKQAILAPYDGAKKKELTRNNSEHIVTAFRIFEKDNIDNMRIQHFTAVAPYATMHNDICTVAYDRGVNMVIIPFHKNKGNDKVIEASACTSIRNVNRKVLRKAPCSVGILIERDESVHRNHHHAKDGMPFCSIAMLFFGGYDDHEALAYSKHMVDDSNVKLTIIRIKSEVEDDLELSSFRYFDDLAISEFFASIKNNKENIRYQDLTVQDGVGTTKIIRSIEDSIDLMLVGRRHDSKLPSISGLMDWSEWPELGAVGAMLTSWDFQFSVLVIQHQKQDISTCTRQNSTNSLCSIREDY